MQHEDEAKHDGADHLSLTFACLGDQEGQQHVHHRGAKYYKSSANETTQNNV